MRLFDMGQRTSSRMGREGGNVGKPSVCTTIAVRAWCALQTQHHVCLSGETHSVNSITEDYTCQLKGMYDDGV